MEDGRVTIETDVASLGVVLHEIGWPHAFARTGAPLRITFQGASTGIAVRRRLRDANYVVVESNAGRGEVRLYPEGRGNGLASLVPEPRDPSRPAPGPARAGRGTDPALIARLRDQVYTSPMAAQRARAMAELAAYAEDDLVRDTALEILRREQNSDVLESALDALEDLPAVPASPLVSFITRERRSALRAQAIELLGRRGQGDAAARELLTRLATGHDDARVRGAARTALEELVSSQ